MLIQCAIVLIRPCYTIAPHLDLAAVHTHARAHAHVHMQTVVSLTRFVEPLCGIYNTICTEMVLHYYSLDAMLRCLLLL